MRVGDARPPHFTISTITFNVVVYAPTERADTLPLFLLYPSHGLTPLCTLCMQLHPLMYRAQSRVHDPNPTRFLAPHRWWKNSSTGWSKLDFAIRYQRKPVLPRLSLAPLTSLYGTELISWDWSWAPKFKNSGSAFEITYSWLSALYSQIHSPWLGGYQLWHRVFVQARQATLYLPADTPA